MIDETRCPACGAFTGFQRSRTKGIWERSLAKIARLKAYRCVTCQGRILRRSLPILPLPGGDPSGAPEAPHLKPQQSADEFDQLIRDMAAKERRNQPPEAGPR